MKYCYAYNIFTTNLMWQHVIGRLKSDINIGSRKELVTPYHIKFVVKLCEKYCKGRITHIFVKLKLLWFSN